MWGFSRQNLPKRVSTTRRTSPRSAMRFEVTVNLRSAKARGVVVPPGVLIRADHVIE